MITSLPWGSQSNTPQLPSLFLLLYLFSIHPVLIILSSAHLCSVLSRLHTSFIYSLYSSVFFFSCKAFSFPSTPPLCDISLSPVIIVLRFTSTTRLHLPPSFPVLMFPSAFRGLQNTSINLSISTHEHNECRTAYVWSKPCKQFEDDDHFLQNIIVVLAIAGYC